MAGKNNFVGLELGQPHEYTTIALVERVETTGDWDAVAFAWKKRVQLRLRHLERLAVGTSYPEVMGRMERVTNSGALSGACEVVADGTMVGKPAIDLLRKAGLESQISAVVLTGGNSESYAGGFIRVPKKNLITGLQLALQQGSLQIAAGLENRGALVAEMSQMRVEARGQGGDDLASWREGAHDDLVFAVALACWAARRAYPRDLGGGQQYWTGWF